MHHTLPSEVAYLSNVLFFTNAIGLVLCDLGSSMAYFNSLVATSSSLPTVSIHRSAWKRSSRKFAIARLMVLAFIPCSKAKQQNV